MIKVPWLFLKFKVETRWFRFRNVCTHGPEDLVALRQVQNRANSTLLDCFRRQVVEGLKLVSSWSFQVKRLSLGCRRDLTVSFSVHAQSSEQSLFLKLLLKMRASGDILLKDHRPCCVTSTHEKQSYIRECRLTSIITLYASITTVARR